MAFPKQQCFLAYLPVTQLYNSENKTKLAHKASEIQRRYVDNAKIICFIVIVISPIFPMLVFPFIYGIGNFKLFISSFSEILLANSIFIGLPAGFWFMIIVSILSLFVPEDRKKLKALAGRGDATSQLGIGALYATGRGVPRDVMQAYKWYALAAEQGNRTAADNCSTMAAQMTDDQLADAKLLVDRWNQAERERGPFKPHLTAKEFGAIGAATAIILFHQYLLVGTYAHFWSCFAYDDSDDEILCSVAFNNIYYVLILMFIMSPVPQLLGFSVGVVLKKFSDKLQSKN